jgi:hypothetical protein
MSSQEEDLNDTETNTSRSAKKRRVQRACDVCRRKKSAVLRNLPLASRVQLILPI